MNRDGRRARDPMLHRIAQYLFAFVVLGAACGIYQATFVVWLAPSALPEISMAGSPGLRKDDQLEQLFPPDAWQRSNCKRLYTRDGVLLFEKWEQLSDDQWKLWPVSVVIGLRGDSPLVLNASEGAEIKFTESLDVLSGGAPPIERGRMIGAVTIHNGIGNEHDSGPPLPGGNTGSRRIRIEASEVGIDHRKVWTTQPIQVQLGDIQLRGRDLTLHLSTSGGLTAAGSNTTSILDRLELIYLDELTVPLAPGGLWEGRTPPTTTEATPSTFATRDLTHPSLLPQITPKAPTASNQGLPPGLASLRCGGQVVFQFGTGELTLQDRVELRHQASIESDQIDSFDCDSLRMRFTDLLAKRKVGEQLQDYLLSMTAVGRPARANLPSFDANLAAGQIEFDTRTGLLQMGGPAGVLVSYAGNRWHFGQVNYLVNPTDPKQMGTFDAIGPGVMEVAQRLDIPIQRLQWKNGIKFERLENKDLLALRIDGQVLATMTDGGTFRCNSAFVEMRQEATLPVASNDAGAAKQTLTKLTPSRFLANGEVRLETPAIAVATGLLQLYFDVAPVAPTQSGTPDPQSVAANNVDIRRWIKQPQGDSGNASLVANSTPVVRSRPSIHGDVITAKLKLSGGDVTARDLTVVGSVSLRHEIETQSGPLQALMTGDRLVLSDGGGSDVLQIGSGVDRPARFELGDGHFIGPLIQVRMADNVVWIKDAGEFRMPTQVLPSVAAIATRTEATRQTPAGIPIAPIDVPTSTPIPSKIEWVSAPVCRWKGQMVFDGRTAVLSDGVEIHATLVAGEERDLWDVQMVGDQLQLVLDQDVRVREVESVRSATIHHITLTSSVTQPLLVTANQLNSDGLRKARHVLAAPKLTLQPGPGTLQGPGPGWYRAWLETASPTLFAQPSNVIEPELSSMFGVHLVYDQSLDADINRRNLDFTGAVRIASRRVISWDDVIEVTQMQGLRLGETMLESDRIRIGLAEVRTWAPVTAPWELEAIGTVAFQTRNEKGLFSGTAERASYAASKDTFVIEGVPGRGASMNQTLPTGQPGMSWGVKRMVVNPKTMEIQNVELDRVQLGTLPSNVGR